MTDEEKRREFLERLKKSNQETMRAIGGTGPGKAVDELAEEKKYQDELTTVVEEGLEQWEYLNLSETQIGFKGGLNRLGGLAWELVCVTILAAPDEAGKIIAQRQFTFKRRTHIMPANQWLP